MYKPTRLPPLGAEKIIDNRVGLGMSVKDVGENVEEDTLIEEELMEDPPSPPSSPLSTPQMSKYVPRVPFPQCLKDPSPFSKGAKVEEIM